MVGSLAVALVAGALAFAWYYRQKKVTLVCTFLTTPAMVALLVAFPGLVLRDTIHMPAKWVVWLVLALGVVAAVAGTTGKGNINLLMPFGILLAVWALFYDIPSIAVAFSHLGPNLGKVGDDLWKVVQDLTTALKAFVEDATS
jgi:hypothetical protein